MWTAGTTLIIIYYEQYIIIKRPGYRYSDDTVLSPKLRFFILNFIDSSKVCSLLYWTARNTHYHSILHEKYPQILQDIYC